MVKLKDVRKSNEDLSSLGPGIVAIFVGATSGVGKSTLKQFAKYDKEPKAYIVGRSKARVQSFLDELDKLNPNGTFTFIETEISLIKNCDDVCEQIKEKEKKVDVVFLSTGYLSFEGRHDTPEGIDELSSLNYYARFRVIYNLLPLLKQSPVARVVSILGGGKESAIDADDLQLKNYSLLKAVATNNMKNTLTMELLAQAHPEVSFVHQYPGFVNTGQLDRFMLTAKGLWSIPAQVARYTLVPFVSLFARTVDVAGEYGLFIATSARYPSAKPKEGQACGVKIKDPVGVCRSSIVIDGKTNGMYRVDENGESAPDSEPLVKYRDEKLAEKIWEETEETWNKAIESAR